MPDTNDGMPDCRIASSNRCARGSRLSEKSAPFPATVGTGSTGDAAECEVSHTLTDSRRLRPMASAASRHHASTALSSPLMRSAWTATPSALLIVAMASPDSPLCSTQ